jgi:hypothetical protein
VRGMATSRRFWRVNLVFEGKKVITSFLEGARGEMAMACTVTIPDGDERILRPLISSHILSRSSG